MYNVWVATDWHCWSRDNRDSRHPYRSVSNLGQLADNYAEEIQVGDLFVHLGDLCDPAVTDPKQLTQIVNSIPCRKILCKGNHDIQPDEFYLQVGFDEVCDICKIGNLIFSHKPVRVAPDEVNIHGHLHTRKLSTLGSNHINAFRSNFDTHPVLVEDLLEKAPYQDPEDWKGTELRGVEQSFEQYLSIDNDHYDKILDLTDEFDDYPIDEATGPDDTLMDIIEFNRDFDKKFQYGLRINRRWDPNRNTTDADWDKYLVVQSPERLEKSMVGVCWDCVSYEAWYFRKNFPDVKFKTYYMQFFNGEDCPTHTILTFTLKNVHYYFEVSFRKFAGVYAAKSEEDIISYVLKLMSDNPDPSIPKGQLLKQWEYGVWEYDALDPAIYGMHCQEYMDYVMGHGKCMHYVWRKPRYPVTRIDTSALSESSSILDEVLFEDLEDTEYWEQDDDYKPSTKTKEPMADGESGIVSESLNQDQIIRKIRSYLQEGLTFPVIIPPEYTGVVLNTHVANMLPQILPLLGAAWLAKLAPLAVSTASLVESQLFAVDIIARKSDNSENYIFGGPGHIRDMEVCAVADGTIHKITSGHSEDDSAAAKLTQIFGNCIVIKHGMCMYSIYAHLASISCKVGTKVRAGQVVGTVGSTGNSSEPHLHFQVCVTDPSLAVSTGILHQITPLPNIFLNSVPVRFHGISYAILPGTTTSIRASAKNATWEYADTSNPISMSDPMKIYLVRIGTVNESTEYFTYPIIRRYPIKTTTTRPAWITDEMEVRYTKRAEDAVSELIRSDHKNRVPEARRRFKTLPPSDMLGANFLTKHLRPGGTINKTETDLTRHYYLYHGSNYRLLFVSSSNTCEIYLIDSAPSDFCKKLGSEKINVSLTGRILASLHESVLKSSVDKDHKQKGTLRLSQFAQYALTKERRKKYMADFPNLRHFYDHGEKSHDSIIWVDDNDHPVAAVSVYYENDDPSAVQDQWSGHNWISELEVAKEYRGYGLSKQVLNYAVRTLKADALGVADDNKLAQKVYLDYGFKMSQDASGHNHMMYLPESATYQEVKAIVDAIPQEEHHLFYNTERNSKFVDSPYVKYRDVAYHRIRGMKYGAFLDVYADPEDTSIGNIVVAADPLARGTGIADKLVKKLLKNAKSTGLKTLHWKANKDNIPSIKLAERNGFYRGPDEDGKCLYIYDIEPNRVSTKFQVKEEATDNPNDPISSTATKLTFYLQDEKIGEASISAVDTTTGFLYDVEVFPKYRGKGYGTDIMHYIMTNYNVTELTVEQSNTKAIKLYEKFGFTIRKRFRENGKPMYDMQYGTGISESYKYYIPPILTEESDFHEMDPRAKRSLMDKHGLKTPGQEHEYSTDPDKEEETDAEKRLRERKKKQMKNLKKARRVKKRKAFVRKLKSHLPGAKNEEVETDPFNGDQERFFEPPDHYAEYVRFNESFRLEMLDNVKFFDPINESTDGKKKEPVYVVLISGNSPVSALIRGFTHSEYTHVSISFDSSLTKMYSFAGKDKENAFEAIIGGFKTENIQGKFFKENKIPYAVYVVPSTQDEIARMKKRLDYFIRNETKFRFDYGGLVKNFLKVEDYPQNRWFCSRFVGEILNAGRPDDPYVDKTALLRPEDFKTVSFAQFVEKGADAAKFNAKQMEKRARAIMRQEAMKFPQDLPVAVNETVVYDVDPICPMSEAVVEYLITQLDESAFDEFLIYLKSFKVKFDKDGNVIISRREIDQLDHRFRQTVREAKAYQKAGNVEGVKECLAQVYFMIELVNQHYLNPKTIQSNRVKADVKKEMMDLRSVMLNMFQQNLKWVTNREPQFNFKTYYDGSKYGKNTYIPKEVLTVLGKTIVTALH